MFCEKEDGVEGLDWRLRYLITKSEVREKSTKSVWFSLMKFNRTARRPSENSGTGLELKGR